MCALGWPTDLVFTQYAALVVSYTLSISMGLAILCGRKKGETQATKKSAAPDSESSSSSSSVILKPPEKKHKKASSKEGKSKEGKAQTPSSKRKTGESVRKGVRAPAKAPAPAAAPAPIPLPPQQTLSQFQKAESLKSLPPMKSIAPMPLQSAARTLQLQTAMVDDVSKARPLSLSQMSTLKETAPGSDGAYEDVNIVVEPELITAAPGGEKLVEAKAPPEPGMEDEGLKTVKPEALRDVPPTGDASKTTLTVDPPVSTFPTTGGRLCHTLKNPRGTRMVFKIKCSNNNDYGINPVYGFVEANGTVPITITRLPGPPKDDRMVIQFVETTEAPSVGAEAAFKLASPWAYVSTTVPLKVVAGLPPMAPTAGAKPPPPASAAVPKPPPPPPPAPKPIPRTAPAPVPISPRPVVPVAAGLTRLPPPPPSKPAPPAPVPPPKVAAASPRPVPVATKVPIPTPPPPPKALSPTPAKPVVPARPSPLIPPAAPKPGAPLAPPGTGLSYFAAPGQTPVIPGLPSPTAPPPAGVPPAFTGAKGLPVASVYVTQQRK